MVIYQSAKDVPDRYCMNSMSNIILLCDVMSGEGEVGLAVGNATKMKNYYAFCRFLRSRLCRVL
jgi:hypothetical protein